MTDTAVQTARTRGRRMLSHRYVALDGLRGAALIPVLIHHSNLFARFPVGVDMFFALSGFFVTSILFREIEKTGRVRLAPFYLRRFKRLTPALLIVLAGTVALVYVFGHLSEAQRTGPLALAALGQFANWTEANSGNGYWSEFGQHGPLDHMWSLSMTEQFYLLWPLVVVLSAGLIRRRPAVFTGIVATLCVVAGAVAPLLYDGTNADNLYLSSRARAVTFLCGALAACLARHGNRSGRTNVVLALLGLSVLVASGALLPSYEAPLLYEGGFAVVAAAAAMTTLGLCAHEGPLVRMFSWPPLVEFGRVSYALYLVHLPVFWLLQQWYPGLRPYVVLVVGTLVSWPLATVLHYGAGERLRRRPWSAARAFPVLALSTAGLMVAAMALPAAAERKMNPDGKPVVLALGDSVSGDFARALAYRGAGRFATFDGAISGCGIMTPERVIEHGQIYPTSTPCRAWEQSWRTSISNSRPMAIIVDLSWDSAEQQWGATTLSPCDDGYRDRYLSRLAEAARLWRSMAPHVPVLLAMNQKSSVPASAAQASCYTDVLRDFASTDPQTRLLDMTSFVCPNDVCRSRTAHGVPLYLDGVHLTPGGIEELAPWLRRAVAAALQSAAGTPPKAPSDKATTATSGTCIPWGVYIPSASGQTVADVRRLERRVGKHASQIMWYGNWNGPYATFDPTLFQQIIDHGATPVLSWQSTGYTDAAIATGRHDAFIRSWAEGLKRLHHTVLLRFDFEMNGNWEPWSPGVNGNTVASYVAMWRHVHDIFRRYGAVNVQWVWSANVEYKGVTPMAQLYPGDNYTDFVGLDGYNWDTVQGNVWKTFDQIFSKSLDRLGTITSKPQLITETGSAESADDAHSKAAWITDLLSHLATNHPSVKGITWFDANKETDWRINSSAASTTAFAHGIASPYYEDGDRCLPSNPQ